jgi:hypothetical protein
VFSKVLNRWRGADTGRLGDRVAGAKFEKKRSAVILGVSTDVTR